MFVMISCINFIGNYFELILIIYDFKKHTKYKELSIMLQNIADDENTYSFFEHV